MPPVLARLALVAAALLFSTGGAAIKATQISGVPLAAARSAVAAIVLAAVFRPFRALAVPKVWLVGCAYAGTMVLFVLGNKLTTAAHTIYLQSTAPLHLLVLGPLVLGERLHRRDLAAGACVAAGLAVLLAGPVPASDVASDPSTGNLLALGAGVCWALTLLGLRLLAAGSHDRAAPAATIAGNVLAAAVAAAWAEAPAGIGWTDVAVVVYLGAVQIALAYACLTRAIAHVPAFEASVILLLEPVLAPAWAYLAHGERPGPVALLGGALVVAGAVLQLARPDRPG